MSEDPSISTPSESVDDSNLASLSAGAASGSSKAIGYIAIVLSLVFAGVYLLKYSGGFESNEYLEYPGLADEIASFRGGSAGGDEAAAGEFDPLKEGKKIYMTNCMACHQATGMGIPGAFPPLAGSDWIGKNTEVLARIVLNGLSGPITVSGTEYNSIMAPLGMTLNDEQIAMVLTYVGQEWGNAADPVDAAAVTQVRADVGDRTAMWTVEELKAWDN